MAGSAPVRPKAGGGATSLVAAAPSLRVEMGTRKPLAAERISTMFGAHDEVVVLPAAAGKHGEAEAVRVGLASSFIRMDR